MKVRRIHVWLMALALLLTGPCIGASSEDATKETKTITYRLWYRNYDSPPIRALVALAFDKTPEYGPYRITRTPEMAQGRVVRELEQQQSELVDLANVATSSQREEKLQAIPIPIDGGLLGLRVCIVLKESLPKFKGIHSLDDMQEAGIRVGQGAHWPDSSILQVNGINVVTHSRYEILFGMLENHRFECFARGVGEVLFDLALENNKDFVIEPDLLLAYPMPSYFFVNRNDHETAHRLQLGMERAIFDGSFGAYLNHYYGRAIDELNLSSRNVLVLDNPYLTDESWAIGSRTLRELQRRIRLLSSPQSNPRSNPES
jgi:hypothetical protein